VLTIARYSFIPIKQYSDRVAFCFSFIFPFYSLQDRAHCERRQPSESERNAGAPQTISC
jgi:hypothetical protein